VVSHHRLTTQKSFRRRPESIPRYYLSRQVDRATHDSTSPTGWIPAFAGMTRWVGRIVVPTSSGTLHATAAGSPPNFSHPPRVTLGLDPRALYFKMLAMGGFVYILANMRRGRTYIGVTNDLLRRVYEHREGLVEGYTKSRDIKRLVYSRHSRGADEASGGGTGSRGRPAPAWMLTTGRFGEWGTSSRPEGQIAPVERFEARRP
jgi:hypothetical protein